LSDISSAYAPFYHMLGALVLPGLPSQSAFSVFRSPSQELLVFELTISSSYSMNESDRFSHLRITEHVALTLFEDSALSQSTV